MALESWWCLTVCFRHVVKEEALVEVNYTRRGYWTCRCDRFAGALAAAVDKDWSFAAVVIDSATHIVKDP